MNKQKLKTQPIPTVPLWRFLIHSFDIVKNPLPFHRNNFEKLGPTFSLKIGFNKEVVFSKDAQFLQYVLQKNHKNFTKSTIQTIDLAKYVGKGLLTAEGIHWKKQRKLIQPAFHKKQLMLLLQRMQETISSEVKKIPTNIPFNIFKVFNDLAFQVVVQSLFSGEVHTSEIKRLQHITEAAQKMMVKELRQPYLKPWFIASGLLKKHLQLTQEARNILKTLVNKRKNGTPKNDLLDMLLSSTYEDGTFMDEEQLIDEILILFTAGHETTSNALTFATQLLAIHSKYQEIIFNEIKPIKLEEDNLFEIINNAKYTQACIEESLRLYPPAYFIDRVNIEEDYFANMKFKNGTTLLFAVHEIHKDPNLWENALTFNPERFINTLPKVYNSFYFPFGAGPRMCIGNNFAMYEMVLTIISLIKNFEILPTKKEIEINPLITLKPKNVALIFKPRS